MSTVYFCCEDLRRSAILGRSDLNGIDFLEVFDDPTLPAAQRQRTLFVHFINPPGTLALTAANVQVRGGERLEFRDPLVLNAALGVDARSGTTTPVLVVDLDRSGDYSTYTLTLQPAGAADHSLDRFDPILRVVDFSFKAACESKFDCAVSEPCPPALPADPAIDYLARDFLSFRQTMLDRMTLLCPDWQERSPADVGIVLVELLAYVADYLSYRQDAIATEAYLGTARRRVSVRRHARLVDYTMHNGCNARVFLRVSATAAATLRAGTQALTQTPGLDTRIRQDSPAYQEAIGSGAKVFETLHDLQTLPALNDLDFYTWGARQCCLPKGATKATLRGHLPSLDLTGPIYMVFEERVNPGTGNPADADPRHRQVVRLTALEPAADPIGGLFDTPARDAAVDVTNITWAAEDALTFPLCISSQLDEEFGATFQARVSVAHGNVVLADHGRRITGEDLGAVPAPSILRIPARKGTESDTSTHCERVALEAVPARFRPILSEANLTHAVPFFEGGTAPASASAAINVTLAAARPQLTLHSTILSVDTDWSAKADLLHSGPTDTHVVAEVEADGRAYLRFGAPPNGQAPSTAEAFTAAYRVGNGTTGNVGAESIVHLVSNDPAFTAVINPLAARGGTEMESIDSVRNATPHAFRTQKRAVTLDDYAATAGRNPQVQKAAATLRWTGSWHTTFLSADRYLGLPVDTPFESTLETFLEPFRLAGHDLEIEPPQFVPIDLAVTVQVDPDYSSSQVAVALRDIFSNRNLPDGRQGLFHPDRFTFGQPVYLSPLYAAAQAVAGVQSVAITTFQRQDDPASSGIDDGKLIMGRLEIAQLDNDPNFPGRGSVRIAMRGGR